MNRERRDMKDKFLLSFLFHAGVLSLAFWLGSFARYEHKPLVIDFTFESSSNENRMTEHGGRGKAVAKTAAALPLPQKKLPSSTMLTGAQPVLQELAKETKPVETSPHAAPVKTVQVTGGSDSDKNTGAAFSGSSMQSMTGHAVGDFNGSASSSQPGGEDSGIRAEQEKKHYLKEHFAYIRDMILRKLSYPIVARKMGWSGKVTVSFVICEDGTVEETKVVKSSGYDILDKNTLDTIRKACPFPRPPVKAELVMPVSYKLQ